MFGKRACGCRGAHALLAAVLAAGALLSACAEREVGRMQERESSIYCPISGTGNALITTASAVDPWFSEARAVRLASAAEFLRNLDRKDGRRGSAGERRLSVPTLLAVALPDEIASMKSVPARKRAFITAVLPVAVKAHDEILAERGFVKQVEACRLAGMPLNPASQHRFATLMKSYRAKDDTDWLLRRLDVVPLSLILAQSAIESGWGTSRFARRGNALFGQRTFNKRRGMKPDGLEEDTRVLVATFPNLLESVRSYLRNINTHPAYLEFRMRRAGLRTVDGVVTGLALADTLASYSERGSDYIRDLRAIIRHNGFDALDHLGLEMAGPPWAERSRRPTS